MPVEVRGVIELKKAMRQFAPDLGKQLTREMGAALKPIVRKSRSLMPGNEQMLSNWVGKAGRAEGKFPQYDVTIVRKGITFKTSPSRANRRGFKSIASIFNKSAAGAIYETAGRKTPNSIFVQNLQVKSGGVMKGKDKMQGRGIFRAWNEDQGKATTAVLRAIEKATNLFYKRTSVR
jgi:glutathione synthase/RimK-type ligase-like ATP-grasp enzyme